MAKIEIRDRIVELRRVKASELAPNPLNWRKHSRAQTDALRGLLSELGYVGALLARETADGLMLIDGHLRASVTPDSLVPVLVLDVDEQEAKTILATYDPLAAMAEADAVALDALLREVESGDAAVMSMLAELAEKEGVIPVPSLDELGEEYGEPDESQFWPVIRVQVPPETNALYKSLIAKASGEDEAEKLGQVLRAVDETLLSTDRG